MKLNEHERARPSLAGLVSSSQQSEMKLLLAGAWPALRPLPVFKYEAEEYRASIEFDKGRGEWFCRKTFLPSNKVEESRGGLAELAKALPPAQAEAFGGCPATAHQGQEFARETGRRLQAILEWKGNFENGALYSELQGHLSESQQREVEEILRLTLTARQLQFSAKNIECVFDALSKAGGRLAMLLEVAKRKSVLQEEEPAANLEAATSEAAPGTAVFGVIPAAIEDSQEEGHVESALPAEEQALPDLPVQSTPEAAVRMPAGSFDAEPASLVEETEEGIREVSAAARPQIQTRRFGATAHRGEYSTRRRHVLEISGVHIAAFAVVFLFAVISLPIGLTVGRGPLGQWFQEGLQSLFGARVTPPAAPDDAVETASKGPAPPPIPLADSDNPSRTATPDAVTPPEEKPRENAQDSESSVKAAPATSNSLPATESRPSIHTDAVPERDGSTGGIARDAAHPAGPNPAHSRRATDSAIESWKSPVRRPATVSRGTPRRRSMPSGPSGILVSSPAHGSKPFRVSFPEKPIAASSSVAMTSELSVLVPPVPRPEMAHRSSRLQAGELVSFVWPRYPQQGDRYGVAETVRVRATVGQLGEVLDIKLLSGPAALFPATKNAIRLWRYRPTFLNKRPVPVQQDITIEFRPPQYLSRVHTQHPS